MNNNCVCGSGQKYEKCCGRFHNGDHAETPEQLMRSRYAAFVLQNADYLKRTWVPEMCSADLSFDSNMCWLRLEIIKATANQVEFKAWFLQRQKLHCLHEISDFIDKDGQWFYHAGQLIEEPTVDISRNQPCPCGSGKKFKRCCL